MASAVRMEGSLGYLVVVSLLLPFSRSVLSPRGDDNGRILSRGLLCVSIFKILSFIFKELGFFKKARMDYLSQVHPPSFSAPPSSPSPAPGGEQTAAGRLTGAHVGSSQG